MQKVLLITDLWGGKKSSYINSYKDELEKHYEVSLLDACYMARIDQRVYTEAALHRQFVQGGIEKAVDYLCATIKEPVLIIGFSIGGLIGWKFAKQSTYVQKLICISSTRLRKETEKPPLSIELYFGEDDPHKPSSEWFSEININPIFFAEQGHGFYKSNDSATEILKNMLPSRVE